MECYFVSLDFGELSADRFLLYEYYRIISSGLTEIGL